LKGREGARALSLALDILSMTDTFLTPADIDKSFERWFQDTLTYKNHGDGRHTWVFRLSRYTYWLNYHPALDDRPPVIGAAMTDDESCGNDLTDGLATVETLCKIFQEIIGYEAQEPAPTIADPSTAASAFSFH
jgi:hypothetical protein